MMILLIIVLIFMLLRRRRFLVMAVGGMAEGAGIGLRTILLIILICWLLGLFR